MSHYKMWPSQLKAKKLGAGSLYESSIVKQQPIPLRGKSRYLTQIVEELSREVVKHISREVVKSDTVKELLDDLRVHLDIPKFLKRLRMLLGPELLIETVTKLQRVPLRTLLRNVAEAVGTVELQDEWLKQGFNDVHVVISKVHDQMERLRSSFDKQQSRPGRYKQWMDEALPDVTKYYDDLMEETTNRSLEIEVDIRRSSMENTSLQYYLEKLDHFMRRTTSSTRESIQAAEQHWIARDGFAASVAVDAAHAILAKLYPGEPYFSSLIRRYASIAR